MRKSRTPGSEEGLTPQGVSLLDLLLKDLAAIIAKMNGKEVIFEIPDAIEAAGYSTATKARLNGRSCMTLDGHHNITYNAE